MNTELYQPRGASFGPMLVGGLASALAAACAWFFTHLPWLALSEQAAIPIILLCWLVTLSAVAARVRAARSVLVGLGSGLISGLAGLVFFGMQLGAPRSAPGEAPSVVPQAWLLVLGFLALSLVLGLVAGIIGRLLARRETLDQPAAHWLARLAVVACVAIAPLIFIGGLVTSTQSGMAVPDWPRTYGANMFLYPLTGHATAATLETKPYEQVFVEHAHRLFGSFVGLTMLVLLVFTLAVERRRLVRWFAVGAFLLVCLQGVLGGLRVRENSTWLALVHGVVAQLTFAFVASLAVLLSDHFRSLTPGQRLLDPSIARRVKRLCTFAAHGLILQLLLGAAYRHLRSGHILWTHIAWSVIIALVAVVAGFTLAGEPVRRTVVGGAAAATGLALALVVTFQFLLGWVTFAFAGRAPDPASITQAMIRTAHQANGALVLALAAAAYVWAIRLSRPKPDPSAVAA